MDLQNKIVFVTGTNRGIGKAIVEALLKQKVKKIYAGARKPEDLPDFKDERVVPVKLDITNDAQIKQAVAKAQDVNLLINNAGVASHTSLLDVTDNLMLDMNVNYVGTVNMVRAFLPVLTKNGGAIANVISVVGLASIPMVGGYSASKAALFSATQALRAELKPKNVSVYAIFPGPIDTDMAKEFEAEKASPELTAENILKGIIANQEDIFPDPMSEQVSQLWATNPKGLEQQFASWLRA